MCGCAGVSNSQKMTITITKLNFQKNRPSFVNYGIKLPITKNMDVTYKTKSLILTLNLATAGSVVFSIYEKQFKTGLHLKTTIMNEIIIRHLQLVLFENKKCQRIIKKTIKKL